MATLTGKKISESYKDLLQVSNSNAGVDGTLRDIEDGEGTASVLQISSSSINIKDNGALQINETAVTSTAAELNLLDGVTATTSELNILDGVTATASELNILDGVTATTAELNYVDGVTSNIQTQLDSKISATLTQEQVEDIVGGMLDGTETGISVSYDDTDGNIDFVVATQSDNNFTTTLLNKLNAIEASADVTDTANVTSAGALMDSELASIANVKALDQSVVSGAEPTFGTANMSDASNKRFMTDAQETKLDSVESNADVTDATNVTAAGALMDSEVSNLSFVKGLTKGISDGNVLTANDAVSDNDFLRIDGTEVEGRTAAEVRSDLNVEDGADVTDTANVTSAGALMDSEVDADLKTFALPANTTISTFGKSIVDDADAAAVRTTIGVDAAGTDNSTNVSLSGSLDYITISGQTITRNAVDLAADVTGTLPVANGGIGATSLNNLITLSTHTTGNYVAGISGTSNEIEVSGSGSEGATVTIGLPDDVTIAGDLTVNGDTVTVSTATLTVEDPLIKLAKGNNSADSVDIGFYGLYDTSGSQDLYAGLFRDANDSGKFKLFKDLQAEPTTTVNVSGTGYAVATLVSNLEGNVTGNASTATALQNGRDFSYTGDVTGTTASQFDGTGDISIALTIASTAVEGSMLNNNVISGQTDMTGDVDDADELMISDAGTLKRIDFSVLRDAVYNDVSGDATIADGGALTIANNSVALGTDTTGNYVATVADSGTGGITVANSGSESAAVTVELDINGLTAATLASGDFLAFSDESATGDPTKKESIDDIATLFAGAGLTASSAVINLDITGFDAIAEGALTEASDVMLVYDDSAGVNKKITIEDLEDAIGGTGTVTNVVAGTGLSGGGTTTATLDLDFSELTDMTGDISGSTEFILQDGTTESRKAASEIKLSNFNNDSGFVTANTMGSGFVLEDGDGTEVTITENKEVKFIDGTGMQINWSNTSNGTDADPYDLTFELDVDGLTLLNEAPADADTFILYDDSASAIKKVPASEVGSDTTYSAGSGLDLSSTTFSVDVSDFMANGANNYIVTATGTDAMNAEANLTFDGTNLDLPDSKYIRLGNGNDFYLQHDGTNSYLRTDTGDLYLQNANSDGDVFIRVNDGGSTINAIQVDTSETGKVRLPNDGQTLSLGAGNDLTFQHDGNNTYFSNGTGNLYISTDTNDGDLVLRCDDGSGGTTAYLTLDGSATKVQIDKNMVFSDDVQAQFGGNVDLRIYSDDSNSYIDNENNNLIIQNDATDGDINLKSDNGSGGLATYIQLDGGNVQTQIHKQMRFLDNVNLRIGSGTDLTLYHDGTNSSIENHTGNLYIDNNTNDGEIIFRCDDNSGGLTQYFALVGSQMRTTFTEQIRVADSKQLGIGNGDDLELIHDGSNSYIRNHTGDLVIRNNTDDGDIYLKVDDGGSNVITAIQIDASAAGSVFMPNDNATLGLGAGNDLRLWHDATNSYVYNYQGELRIGNTVDDADTVLFGDDGSGNMTAYLTLDGSAGLTQIDKDMKFVDNVEAQFGSSTDMKIYHNSSSGNGNFENHTGSLYVTNYTNDADIIFRTDDGSGDVTAYLTLDGSAGYTTVQKTLRLDDDVEFHLGTGNDVKFYHDGSHNIMKLMNGNLYFKDQSGNNIIHIMREGDGVQMSEGDFTIPATSKIRLDGSTSGNTYIYEQSGDDLQLIVGNENHLQIDVSNNITKVNADGQDHDFQISGDNQTELFYVDAGNDRVGIGEDSVDAKLHISNGTGLTNVKMERVGNAAWRFGIAASGVDFVLDDSSDDLSTPEFAFQNDGDFHADGDVIAYSTTTSSDERLKENIKEIPYGLEEVLKMKPVEYDWKEKRGGKHDIGVIAQDIEKLIPEIIKENKDLKTKEDFKSVDYGKMVAVLIKAIQEQQEEIELLKANLDQLKYNRR